MIDFEKRSGTIARVVDLNELYPDAERMPVSSKLRTYLRQVSLKIAPEKMLENNSYLDRLVAESSLFLPEIFLNRWVKHWEYQVAIALEGVWVSSSLDFAVDRENEILIVDWSGMQGDATHSKLCLQSPASQDDGTNSAVRRQAQGNAHQDSDRLAVAQAYLLSQRLGFEPQNISVVSLIANPLNEDRRINFIRRLFGDNDFQICQRELGDRLVRLVSGKDLNPEPEPNELDILLDIESIPEIAID